MRSDDGSMNVVKKEAALDKIRKDASYTIILIRYAKLDLGDRMAQITDVRNVDSIKAGAVGLNLTECSRVILCDLWWNPQIQEQAFDRYVSPGVLIPYLPC